MKQVRPVLILFVLLFLANTLQAQTTKNLHYPTPKYPELFKTIPLIDSETPKWAVAMYGENPNVYQVVEMYRDYYKTHKFVKTIHTQNFKHWQWRVEEYIDAEGFIEMPDQKTEERQSKRLKERFEARQEANHSLKKTGASSEWYSMGPFETYKQNTTQPVSIHKNIYSIDQSESNPDLLICGTEAGGVFKSTDKGLNWSLTNKSENFVGGNGAVKIHPTNANVFLVASNSRIYRSTDGGTTWNEEHYMGAGGYEFRFHPVQTDIIFCAASNGLYRSDNGGDTWAKIFSERCWDIDFHPTDEEVIYLLKTNSTAKRAEVFRSDDTGATWTLKDNGYFSPSDLATASDGGGKIAVSAAAGAADIVYVCLIGAGKAADGGWVGVYKSTDKGENWVNPSGQDGAPEEGYGSINGETMWNVAAYSGGYHQGFYNFDFEVSDTDADVLWIATIRLTESADGGATFTSIGAANSQRLSDIHADVQDLEVNGGDIWVATDGGLNFSDDELMTHDSRKKGISASHFWGFNTGWNEDVFTGGRYHDGTIAYYEGYGLGNVHHVGGVEEPSGYVHPVESRKVYYRTHYASDYTSVKTVPTILGETTIGHSSLPLYPNESYSTSRSSGLYFHPSYADHLFMGRGNSIFKSTNGGSNFDTLYTFPAGAVYEIEISRNNPDIIYTVFKPNGQQCLIYKTLDAGETWTSITNPPANTNRLEISLNPANDHELWVALGSGSNGEMVYKTLNGGLTWQNMTTPTLDGEDTQDIYYQGGTNDVVYVATHNTLFQYDAAANEWIDYGNGLPMIAKVLKIRPFYRDAELRLGSYGRGVWGREMADTNFTPIAQPITYRDSVFCAQDNVQFDCYSILKHEGATWSWSFDPAPLSVSDASARNPQVVFGAEGSYDVTLTITDANGNSHSKTIEGMVTVENRCALEAIAGQALEFDGIDDVVRINPNSDLQFGTSTDFSIAFWMKTDNWQDDASLVSNKDWDSGSKVGWNIALGSDSQGIDVNVGDGSNRADLQAGNLNDGEWHHIAATFDRDGDVTLYVDGILEQSTGMSNVGNVTNDLELTFGADAEYDYPYDGLLEEVKIWNVALTTQEVRENMHLTSEWNTPNLVSYYQFNEGATNAVYNIKGDNHGYKAYGTERVTSTAPIGGGKVNTQTETNGTITFTDTDFEANYSSQNGAEIVASRLNLSPYGTTGIADCETPLDAQYWVVNRFGSNTFNTSITFTSNENLTEEEATNPDQIHLYSRAFNDDGIWTSVGDANSVNTTDNTATFTGITNFNQQFLVTRDANPIINISAASPSICVGESVELTASGAETYTWTPDATLNTNSGATVTASPTETTTYTVIGANAGACESTQTIEIAVNALPDIMINAESNNVCTGESVQLTASGAASYTWIPATTLNNASRATVSASPTETTTYTVTGIDSNGCENTQTVTITVNDLPTIAINAPSNNICGNETVELTASGAQTYTWDNAESLSSNSDAVVTASPTETTTYTVIGIDSNGCENTQTFTVTVATDCCQDGVFVSYSNTNDLPSLTQTSDYIEAGNLNGSGNVVIEASKNVQFAAQNRISLEAGFEVESGGVFSATIADCEGTSAKTVEEQSVVLEGNNGNDLEVKVFPNPFERDFMVTYHLVEDAKVSIRLMDLMGREVKRFVDGEVQFAGGYRVRLEPCELESGVYLLSLEVGGERVVERVGYLGE